MNSNPTDAPPELLPPSSEQAKRIVATWRSTDQYDSLLVFYIAQAIDDNIECERIKNLLNATPPPSPAPDAIIAGVKQNIEVAAQVAFEACKAALDNNYSPLQVAESTAAAVRQLMKNVPLPAPDKGEAIKRAAKKIADDINSIYESIGLQGDPQAEAKTVTFLMNELGQKN